MKVVRKIIKINEEKCDGCGLCVPSCAEGALQVIDGKAKVIADIYCDGLGACLGECPNDALKIIERVADEFDEKAVEKHLETIRTPKQPINTPCGCPYSGIQMFKMADHSPKGKAGIEAESALGHWPIKLKLVPPKAPFLKGADLLVAADCVPGAFASFHQDFLRGKVLVMGCPKFDDKEENVQKFAEMFKHSEIKSVTVVVMEVPCCSAMPIIVQKGMEASGMNIPIEKIVVSIRGKIMK